MAQSYSNSGGTGQRYHLILGRSNVNWGAGGGKHVAYLLNTPTNVIYFNDNGHAVSGYYIVFDFGSARIVDEAKWYQDNATSHGVWQWQGSNDDSSYTNIGSTFTLGGSTTQTQTTLNGNTTPYRYYQLLGVSGNVSDSPYTKAIEFQIDALVSTTPDYGNAYGTGDRTADVTVSQIQVSGNGDLIFGRSGFVNPTMSLFVDGLNRVDGSGAGAIEFGSGHTAVSGRWIQWQFPSAVVIDELRWHQDVINTHGTWKVQGSNDGSSWTDVGTSGTLGGDYNDSRVNQYNISANSVFMSQSTFTGPSGNTTGYIYYRLIGVSGSASLTPFLYEVTFRIADAPAPPSGNLFRPATLSGLGSGGPFFSDPLS